MSNADELIYPTMKQCGDIAESTGGLTKREYFAAMAMQGYLSNSRETLQSAGPVLVARAVMAADALLKELDK